MMGVVIHSEILMIAGILEFRLDWNRGLSNAFENVCFLDFFCFYCVGVC